MAGSTFGTLFKITTWGESHGAGVGVVVDGCPAGLSLCEDDILDRVVTRLREKRMMRLRSSPVFLKERQPERRFPCWYAIRISVPKTTVRSLPTTARDMPI